MTTAIKSTHIELTGNASDPSTPATDKTLLYAKTDNLLYIMGDDGTPHIISGDVFNLNDADDVVLTSPALGQGLKYNGSNWINSNTPTYPQALADLSDVSGATLEDGQTIVSFDGSGYVNAKNRYGYFQKTGITGGVTVYRSVDSLTNRIVYATAGAERQLGGDAEVYDTYFFKARSDAAGADYGVYRMDCWFRFEHVAAGSGGSPTATITVKWAQITGLSINTSVSLGSVQILDDDPHFLNVSHVFDAADASGKDYIFYVEKSNTQPYVMWHQMMIRKVSHSVT
jgi:hypothetical protein